MRAKDGENFHEPVLLMVTVTGDYTRDWKHLILVASDFLIDLPSTSFRVLQHAISWRLVSLKF